VEWHGRLDDDVLADGHSGVSSREIKSRGEETKKIKVRGSGFLVSFFGWEKWMTMCGRCGGGGRALGGPMVSSRRRRVADSSDAKRRPLVAGERKREIEKRVRERGASGSRVSGTRLQSPLFCSFFLAQLTTFG